MIPIIATFASYLCFTFRGGTFVTTINQSITSNNSFFGLIDHDVDCSPTISFATSDVFRLFAAFRVYEVHTTGRYLVVPADPLADLP